MVPVRSFMVKDENGNVCSTLETQSERGRRHFIKILNLHSEFSEEELGRKGETEATATRYGRATIRKGSVGFCGEAEKWKGWWCIWDLA